FRYTRHTVSCSPFPYTTLFRSNHAASAISQRPPTASNDMPAPIAKHNHRNDVSESRPSCRGVLASPGVVALLVIKSFLTVLRLPDRKSTRLNSSHVKISYAVFC